MEMQEERILSTKGELGKDWMPRKWGDWTGFKDKSLCEKEDTSKIILKFLFSRSPFSTYTRIPILVFHVDNQVIAFFYFFIIFWIYGFWNLDLTKYQIKLDMHHFKSFIFLVNVVHIILQWTNWHLGDIW